MTDKNVSILSELLKPLSPIFAPTLQIAVHTLQQRASATATNSTATSSNSASSSTASSSSASAAPRALSASTPTVESLVQDAVEALSGVRNVRLALCDARLSRRVDAVGAALALRLMHGQSRLSADARHVGTSRGWADLLGSDTLLVAWGEFWHAAQVSLNTTSQTASGQFKSVLRQALDPAGTGVVLATQFDALCRAFGPHFDDDCIVGFATLLAEPWFFGFMSLQAADRHLLARAPGTFVVRFATTRPADVAVAYVAADGSVVHRLVRATAAGSAPAFELLGDEPLRFASVAALVAHLHDTGLLRWPLRTALLREPWFFPTMTAADSSAALSGCEPGTFLVRFSNIPGMYTVCFVDDRGKLCHTRIERAGDDDDALLSARAANAPASASAPASAAGAPTPVFGADAGAERYRFVSSSATADTMSVSELINLHSLIFRRPYTHAARTRRMRSVVRVFDVASELPIPPEVLKHVGKDSSTDSPAGIRVLFNTSLSQLEHAAAAPSVGDAAAAAADPAAAGAAAVASSTAAAAAAAAAADDGGGGGSEGSSTLRAVGGAVGGAVTGTVRALLRRRTDASAAALPQARVGSPGGSRTREGWTDRWLVLCDDSILEVDDAGVRARLPLVTSWLHEIKDAPEPFLDAVLPGRVRRLYRPSMPAPSVSAFVARVRRRTLALLGGTEDGRDGTDTYERRHAPFSFADHSYYEGSWREGVFDGVGVFISQHGRYQGQFLAGRRHGYGTYAFATGETYTGEWKSDARHGSGVLQYRAQDIYERFVGTWRNDRRDGRGTLFWYTTGRGQLRSLTCQWARGHLQLERVAALAYDNGSVYCGHFRVVSVISKLSQSGSGGSNLTTVAPNAAVARTLGGMPSLVPSPGHARIAVADESGAGGGGDGSDAGGDTAASRTKKSAERLALQRHGFGAMYESDGALYIGQFSADQRHGNGFFVADAGAELVGEWRDGRPRGRATLTFAGDTGSVSGVVVGPPGVFDPPGALQFSNAVAALQHPAPGGRRNSTLTGTRWAAAFPPGTPSDAGAALYTQSADKHDLKQAARRAADAWRVHYTAVAAALAKALEDGSVSAQDDEQQALPPASSASGGGGGERANGEEQLLLALTAMMSSDDNIIGHAYALFVALFVELRAPPPLAAQLPAADPADQATRGERRGTVVTSAADIDSLALHSQSTPALLVARRNWRGDVPLQEALSDVLGFTSASVRRVSRAFADVPALANMSQRMLDIVLRASDSVLFPKVYDLVYPLVQKRHKADDTRLAKLCDSIREHALEVQFDMFGASQRFCAAVVADPHMYRPCADTVAEMTRCISPAQKLACLVRACRAAEERIARAGKAYGADELLPVLCFALVQSGLADLHAQFAFIDEFVGDTVSHSYDACMFTHFTVALNFLSSPRAGDALAQATAAHADALNRAAEAVTTPVVVVVDPPPRALSPATTTTTASAASAPATPERTLTPTLPPKSPNNAMARRRATKPLPLLPGEPEDRRQETWRESRIAALQASIPELSADEARELLKACGDDVELALQRAARRGRRRTTLAQLDAAQAPFE